MPSLLSIPLSLLVDCFMQICILSDLVILKSLSWGNIYFLIMLCLILYLMLTILGSLLSLKTLVRLTLMCYLKILNMPFLQITVILFPLLLVLKNYPLKFICLLTLWRLLCFFGKDLSPLSQYDTLFTFCIASQYKINLSSFILSFMIEDYIDPSSLPYWLVITHIFKACDVPLNVIPSISFK